MSGKKSSEVAGVLEKANKARMATENNYRNSVNDAINSIQKNSNDINNLVEKFNNMDIQFSTEAIQEFPNEVETIRQSLDILNNQLIVEDYISKLNQLKSCNSSYDNSIHDLDIRSKDLREVIKYKPHYCDNEYRQANQILSEYKQVNNDKMSLLEDFLELKNKSYSEKIVIQNIYNQKEQILKRVKQLNKKALDIVELRNQANKSKDYIKFSFDAIDNFNAEKFLNNEYQELYSIIKEFSNLSDVEVIENVDKVLNSIGVFSSKLDLLYNKWKQEKEQTENHLKLVEIQRNDGKFYRPIEYLANQDNATALDMFQFLSEFSNDEYENSYNELIENAKKCLNNEDFSKSNEYLNSASDILIKARKYADTLQTRLINTTQMAVDTRDIMLKMGFDVNTSLVGETIADGFRVTCQMGDEIIDFENINVEEDGHIIMDINHHEGVKSCGTEWKNLKQIFNEYGIPITDVKKNGKSVIDTNVSSSSTTHGTQKIQ